MGLTNVHFGDIIKDGGILISELFYREVDHHGRRRTMHVGRQCAWRQSFVAERLTGWQHVSISIPNVIRTAHAVPEHCRSGSAGSFPKGASGERRKLFRNL